MFGLNLFACLRGTAAIALLLALAGCAAPVQSPAVPERLLAPASLGRSLTLLQELKITAGGQSRHLEVALEADAESVRMVFMQLGQSVARLEWDGRQVSQSSVPGWPKTVSAERVLGDLQLVWWPAPALRAALPAGWSLVQTAQTRELRDGTRLVSAVRLLSGHVELLRPAEGYRVEIRTQGATPSFSEP